MARNDSISLELQEHANREYCQRRGYKVVAVIEEQKTGRTWSRRKGVREAMRMVEEHEADVIVLYRWSRLSRNRTHWALALDQMARVGGSFESATEPIDVATASGRFTRGVLAEVAAFESERIGESWQEVKAWRRSMGLPSSGGERYGYTWIRDKDNPPERYEIREDQAEVLAWAYRAFIDGLGTRAVAVELNRRGIPSPGGGDWLSGTVNRLLASGFAAGLLSRTEMRDEKVYVPPFPERNWDHGAHTPIISAATWEEYRATRFKRASMGSRAINPTHPLSGLVRCDDDGCGAAMYRRHKSTTHPRSGGTQYLCNRWLRSGNGRCVTVAENRVHRELNGWLRQFANEIDSHGEAWELDQARALKSRTKVQDAKDEVRRIDEELVELTRQLVAKRVPEAAYEVLRDDLLAQLTEAKSRVALAGPAIPARPLKDLRAIAAQVHEIWELAPPVEARALLEQLVSRILVRPSSKPYGRATITVVPTWDDSQ